MATAMADRDPGAIADNLSEKPREILAVFHEEDGVANTHDITTETGYNNWTVANHIKGTGKLAKYGLVEQDGVDESVDDLPRPPNRYVLTERGERVLKVIRQRQAKTEADISRVDELVETVERLEKENDNLQERLDKTEEQVEKHRKAIKYIQEETGIE